MNEVETVMKKRAAELLGGGLVKRVVGWKQGEFFFDPSPAVFESEAELDSFVYNGFCGANLSKYLVNQTKKEGKTAVFLKPCDTYSLNQLLKEHRVSREKVYVIGIECRGKLDMNKIKMYADCVTDVEDGEPEVTICSPYGDKKAQRKMLLLEKCLCCKGKKHMIADETIILNEMPDTKNDRFSGVEYLEKLSADERFKFWRSQLSKCIRCNACRNVCPACTCVKCVFDNPESGIAAKANDTEFEENMYHIIRAFHVTGRCTDCGECSRVCPQNIPLHLINRKFIKDADKLYGEFQAGETADGKTPLTDFKETDPDPKKASEAVNV